ncbi:putative ribonuclease H-like domain-containing protein [Tanacetum coccineum]
MVPRTVLTRSDPISVNAARPVNTVESKTAVNHAGPMKNIINNAYSTARRPFNKITAANNIFNTARPKAVLSAVKGNTGNAVKASACWVWRLKHKVLDHGNPRQDLKDKEVIDSGCSRHMTGNRSYLTNYEEIDGGFVSFGGNSKRGKLLGKDSLDARFKPLREEENKDAKDLRNEDSEVPSTEEPRVNQEKDASVNNTNTINTVSPTVNTAGIEDNVVDEDIVYGCDDDPNMPKLEEIVYSDDDEDIGAEADINNLDTHIPVSPIPTTKINMDHPVEQIIKDIYSASQTRRMTKSVTEHAMFSLVQQRTNHKDFQNCLFACFLSQEEPKKVWTLMDLPNGKRAIGTKWVYGNKKDERGIVIKNKVRLVAQGYTQEEGIDYNEDFAPVARIEAIRLFLAYASFKDFVVYQMEVKSAFLYGKIEEEVYVCQPPRFEDPNFPDKYYKVEKALYGLHQAPRAWYETLSTYLLDNGFQRGKIDKTLFIKKDKGLQVKQKEDGTFISQDKYVNEILNMFGFSDVKTARTPMETQKALLKDADGEDVDEHLYRSIIGSLMYLTSSRPDIMFVVYACARFQVNPKVSHLHAMKRIFRYLKGASLDKKSTTGGYQFLGCRLISWQCKKQTVVANSITKAEYIAASNCLKNPGFHSKTKHIEIKHHFIRDSNEKKLIQMIKIHTDQNVADFLTKAFDVSRIQYLIASINLLLMVKLMLPGITFYCWDTAGSVNAVRLNLVLLVQVNAVEGDFINTSIEGFI